MSQKAPSNRNPSSPPGRGPPKRHRSAKPPQRQKAPTTPAQQKTKQTTKQTLTPLAEALVEAKTFIAMLHKELQASLHPMAEEFLKSFATFFYKNKKDEAMRADSEYVPSSCNWDLSLQVPRDLRQCKDFMALDTQKEAALRECKLKMAGFAKATYSLTRTYYRDRCVEYFCTLLSKAAGGFIAQLDIKSWGKHKAIVDLLALHADEVISPLNIAIGPFLLAYMAAHDMEDADLPAPSVNPNNNQAVCEAIRLIHLPPVPTNRTETAQPTTAVTPNTPSVPVPTAQTEARPTPVVLHDPQTLADSIIQGVNNPPLFSPIPPINPYLNSGSRRNRDQRDTPQENHGFSYASDLLDAEMAALDTPIIGGRAVVISMLLEFIKKVAHAPMEKFKTVFTQNEESRRIRAAMREPDLLSKADKVAATILAERPADRPILQGLIREEIQTTNLQAANYEQLLREVQSLRATTQALLAKQKKSKPQAGKTQTQQQKNSTRGGPNKGRTVANSTKPKHASKTKATRPPSILKSPTSQARQKEHRATDDKAKGTHVAFVNNIKRHSPVNSTGKRRANTTKTRN